MNFATKRPPFVLVVMLAIAAFLLVTTGFATTAASEKQAPRKQALINQIRTEQRNVDDLDLAVAQLRSDVEGARDAAGQQSDAQNQARLQQDRLSELAATTAMQGPATIVRLSDAPKDKSKTASDNSDTSFGTDRVQDNDLQLVVNALFASGAEAIAINDNRVSAVTPIRAAGGTIVVNYRPVSSPYRIVALGADKKLFEQSQVAANFRQWEKEFDLGYSVQSAKNEEVPAYSGRVSIDVAQPSK
jgi:uncharacterized protein YlxW (UPF0749 family)